VEEIIHHPALSLAVVRLVIVFGMNYAASLIRELFDGAIGRLAVRALLDLLAVGHYDFEYLIPLFRILASLVPLDELDPVFLADHNTAASLKKVLEYLLEYLADALKDVDGLLKVPNVEDRELQLYIAEVARAYL
jgi:hypothetical protein